MSRRRNIKASNKPALTITRQALKKDKLVYVAVSNKAHKYPSGHSSIVYIGTTKKGAKRIAESAANRAGELLQNHGVRQLDLYVVWCTPLRRVQTWKKLETALLMAFKDKYGRVPIGNTQGKNSSYKDELDYFSENRLHKILERFSKKNS